MTEDIHWYQAKLRDHVISILNVYIPPCSNIAIYRKIFDLMSQATVILICGGDWNIRISSKLDSSKTFIETEIHKKIKILMSEHGVIDLWRDIHPMERDYTHYSSPHDVYSRIDYFFIHKRDRHRIHQCEHGNIDLSDDAPILLTIQIGNSPRNTLWKLNGILKQSHLQAKKQ